GAFCIVLVAGPFLVTTAKSGGQRAALAVYVVSLLALFGVSGTFHRGRWGPAGARRMRRADHATIFVAISGTNTAVAALALSGTAQIVMLAVVWGGSLVGVLIRQLVLDAPKWVVALPYVVVGWSALAVSPELVRAASWPGFLLLLAGGVAYTVGAVVYARRKPDPVPAVFGFHEVFHSCTIVGATLQFFAIAYFMLPRSR
ncbi:MAG: PAQR family membrane homeostasis protein TrhA, partial [Acidimicrobiales bacterium]